MVDFRRMIVVVLVAALFSAFVFAVIDAIYPNPGYDDHCREKFMPLQPGAKNCSTVEVSVEDRTDCQEKNGYIEFLDYDSSGCPTSYECNTCNKDYGAAKKVHSQFVFYISAVLALIAIFVSLYFPWKNDLHQWISNGFLLGAAFVLIVGTLSTFGDLDRFFRVGVLFLELVLVVFVAYKKIGKA
jgi:hypothetical protein